MQTLFSLQTNHKLPMTILLMATSITLKGPTPCVRYELSRGRLIGLAVTLGYTAPRQYAALTKWSLCG